MEVLHWPVATRNTVLIPGHSLLIPCHLSSFESHILSNEIEKTAKLEGDALRDYYIYYTGDQKYELVIPSAVQRIFFPDQVQDAPQTRDLVVRTGARAANKIPEPRRTMKNAAAHRDDKT